jgi:hypothetical protein
LFVTEKEEEPESQRKRPTDKKKKAKDEFKYKNFFLDEEAQLSDDDFEGESKRKRSKVLDSDEIVDEAEIERELKASKFIIDNNSEAEDEEDLTLATHAMLQRKADMEAIKRLADKFNVESEPENEEDLDAENDDGAEPQFSKDPWAGRILTSDLRYSHGEQLTEEEEEYDDLPNNSYFDQEEPVEEGEFAHTKSNALSDLLKISSDYTVKARQPKKITLPSSKSVLPDSLKTKFSNDQ